MDPCSPRDRQSKIKRLICDGILKLLDSWLIPSAFTGRRKSWEKLLVIRQLLVPYHIKDILIPFFRGGKYTEDDARAVMIQILNVVAFCHLQGVMHRDLKPEVGYMSSGDEDSQLKAIDFGLSDFVEPGWSSKVCFVHKLHCSFHLITIGFCYFLGFQPHQFEE
ncbi:unnamed protein product [Prunus brigantina]